MYRRALRDFFGENLIIGESVFVGYSPEREDPGNEDFSTGNIPKVVSGVTENCVKLMDDFYSILYHQNCSCFFNQVSRNG